MGEEASDYAILGRASESELFHLQSGLDIESVRDLAVALRSMTAEVFSHHVTEKKNDFSSWVRGVFHDEKLASDLEGVSKQSLMAKIIEDHLLVLEEKEFSRYGITLPTNELEPLENYIETKLAQGKELRQIREALLQKGWREKIVDLVLEGSTNKYVNINQLEQLDNIDMFHNKLEHLKKHIINAIVDEETVEDIKNFLKRQGWHNDIIDFIFYDVFKPHPNIQKLSNYIIHQIKDKDKSVAVVKQNLLNLGWKEYIIDSVMYGINSPGNTLQQILSYLDEFSPENHDKIKEFLLQMGWDENQVNDALQEKEIDNLSKLLKENFNVEDGDVLKEFSVALTTTIVKLKNDKRVNKVWKEVLKKFRKIDIMKFNNLQGELHLDEGYTYFYSRDDLMRVKSEEKQHIYDVYYTDQTKPLLIDLENKYLIMPQMIKRQCVVSKKLYPINKLKKIEMWDDTRTHKVTKYVSLKHEKEIKNFLQQTKIVQS